MHVYYKYTTVFVIVYIYIYMCVYQNKKNADNVAKNHDNFYNYMFRFFLTLRFVTWLLVSYSECFPYSCY